VAHGGSGAGAASIQLSRFLQGITMDDNRSYRADPARGAKLELKGKDMKRFEYKVHYLSLEAGKSNDTQLLDALNAFGQEGWRLNRLYGEFSLRALTTWRGGLNMLLEREINDPV
jgi:hypothetical protein